MTYLALTPVRLALTALAATTAVFVIFRGTTGIETPPLAPVPEMPALRDRQPSVTAMVQLRPEPVVVASEEKATLVVHPRPMVASPPARPQPMPATPEVVRFTPAPVPKPAPAPPLPPETRTVAAAEPELLPAPEPVPELVEERQVPPPWAPAHGLREEEPPAVGNPHGEPPGQAKKD